MAVRSFFDFRKTLSEDVDYSLKSLDLGKSLYALSLGVYNYKYMSEAEAKILASLKHKNIIEIL